MKLTGWGRYPVVEAEAHAPRSIEALRALVIGHEGVIARGNGRAYGDSAIGRGATIRMRHFNHMIGFDPATGQLVAEAGVLLGDIISAFLPRGWFPMVTPGTKFVTLGGMIAADVHGKNHHKLGSFRACVDWIEIMGADGEIRRCSREQESALFDNTLGGMGLTGVILRAAIRLQPVESGWIRQKMLVAPNLEAAMAHFEASEEATYSVAWIDCLAKGEKLGRSLVMLGEHARVAELPAKRVERPFETPRKRKLDVPFDFPSFALNRFTVQAFNSLYFHKGKAGPAESLVDWDTYFYPLDAILGWNRIYGRKGFAQFQCVVPLESAEAGLVGLLEAISDAGAGSFLAVLKRFGAQESRIAFPMAGYTLALDFPVNRKTLALMERLDQITIEHGGRFYLAKDSRLKPVTLRAADGRVEEFARMRHEMGLSARFQSAQAERLSI